MVAGRSVGNGVEEAQNETIAVVVTSVVGGLFLAGEFGGMMGGKGLVPGVGVRGIQGNTDQVLPIPAVFQGSIVQKVVDCAALGVGDSNVQQGVAVASFPGGERWFDNQRITFHRGRQGRRGFFNINQIMSLDGV